MPPLDLKLAWRFLYQHRLVRAVDGVAGDFVECGVGTGHTLFLWACALEFEAQDRRLWGFDSFAGLPAPTEEDSSKYRSVKKGDFAAATPSDVRALFEASGYGEARFNTRVTLVPGWFADSLSILSGRALALVHLDVDLCASYRTCLEMLWPLVAPGGVVAFDEYLRGLEHAHFPGARIAIDEFADKNDVEIVRDPDFGKHYVVKPVRTSHAGEGTRLAT
jgi:O-methyltransferase